MSHSGLLYDDPFHGAVLLAFDANRLRKRGFAVHETPGARKCPRQVVFSDGDTRIVIGTNDGRVIVFERATEHVIDELPTGMGAVQTVTVRVFPFQSVAIQRSNCRSWLLARRSLFSARMLARSTLQTTYMYGSECPDLRGLLLEVNTMGRAQPLRTKSSRLLPWWVALQLPWS